MYLPGNQPEQVEILLERYHQLCQLPACEGLGQSWHLIAGTDCRAVIPAGQLIRIVQGALQVSLGDRVGLILQPGDLFTLPDAMDVWPLTYLCDDAAELQVIPVSTLYQTAHDPLLATQITQILLIQNTLLTMAYAAANRYGLRPSAGFQRLKAGSVIIPCGAPADEVFTLMRGAASVELEGVVVGHIQEGDIFGVLAALTDEPRSANVIAQTDVTLMSVPKDQFIRLIQAQPETFMQLLRTLSRQLRQLNQRLVGELRRSGPRLATSNGKSN